MRRGSSCEVPILKRDSRFLSRSNMYHLLSTHTAIGDRTRSKNFLQGDMCNAQVLCSNLYGARRAVIERTARSRTIWVSPETWKWAGECVHVYNDDANQTPDRDLR